MDTSQGGSAYPRTLAVGEGVPVGEAVGVADAVPVAVTVERRAESGGGFERSAAGIRLRPADRLTELVAAA